MQTLLRPLWRPLVWIAGLPLALVFMVSVTCVLVASIGLRVLYVCDTSVSVDARSKKLR